MQTLVCVPILVETVEAALADARQARDLGADIVEFRIDQLFHGEGDDAGAASCERLAAESELPCIITCRSQDEGGEYDGDDASRISLYERLSIVQHPPRYLDLEHATLKRSANLRQKIRLAVQHKQQLRDPETALILSAHDFDRRPANLYSLLAEMREFEEARILKIAFRARSLRDNLEIFDVLREQDRPMIVLGMGEFGLMSRVLAPKFGGYLTFASLRDEAATAPGQPTVSELLTTFGFRRISPTTATYGVIGWPVGHSHSPLVHNAAFELVGHDGVYLPLPIPEEWEHFKATLDALLEYAPLDFKGASITIPHKEHLLRFALEDANHQWRIADDVRAIGAANTLVVHDDGTRSIHNTDASAIARCLLSRFGESLDGVTIGIIGAGGAARAAAYACAEAGADVVIFNRTESRAVALADDLKRGGAHASITAQPITSLGSLRCNGYINCTPIGMQGGPDESGLPIPESVLDALPSQTVIFDTVYRPAQTPLLLAAADRGLRTISGLEMFIVQAAGQFRLWTGHEAPMSLFERVLREASANDGDPESSQEAD